MDKQTQQNNKQLPTQFAPAERYPPEDIATQLRLFLLTPLATTLLENVPDFVMVLNDARQVVFANQALLDLVKAMGDGTPYGLRPGEVFHCVHAGESPGGCGTTQFCSTCGAVRAILSSLHGEEDVQEYRITVEGGGALDLRVYAKPLEVDGKRYVAFTVKDISHEKRRATLEYTFLHDLLNTVQGVKGYTDLLQYANSEEESRVFVERLSALTKRLGDEIDAQRELLKAEDGRLAVKPEPVQSLDLLEKVAWLYRYHEKAHKCHIRVDPQAEDITFISDVGLLIRVLGNMVKNAVEASPADGVVTLGCRRQDNRVELWVHNEGSMPRRVQLQVFQRSFSTKGGGRGLGTYSMRLLSEQYLQGEVGFTSSEESGTTFFARYPLRLEADGEESIPSEGAQQ